MAMEGLNLGVCYYPEQWPEAWWDRDARDMAALGLRYVRIGEFAWSRIEPRPGQFAWDWLDRAIATLSSHGLKIILGTPTATPPKWLVDANPGMLAIDTRGRPRHFGSRRHYCFSSEAYRQEAARIVTAVAERYGNHPAICAWQTDNEYGCHDTVLSQSPDAARRFRGWLRARYRGIDALNTAWGTVFWSQEYRDFDDIDPPFLTVTEANPSHVMDYRRFASDEVVSFNRAQADILRKLSPGRDIVHNFMGFYTEFDHHAVAKDLDVATWDSYPLGFLEQFWFSAEEKARYLRQGHPDVAAFHHDLYRGCGRGRWWVMEQQPGPVNWARFNPAPLPGMVRAWTWEAFAHGAELVSYFRWRQAPFAQEQMHAGLNRPDLVLDTGGEEARDVAAEIAKIGPVGGAGKAPVALIFSYPGDWATEIQPQGQGFRHLKQAFDFYSGLRRLGFDVDILPPDADLAGYALVVVPSLMMVDYQDVSRWQSSGVRFLIGPRTGSKNQHFQIPGRLPPGILGDQTGVRVTRVESLRPGTPITVMAKGASWNGKDWQERVEVHPDAHVIGSFADGSPAWVRFGNFDYLATVPDSAFLDYALEELALLTELKPQNLPEGLRLRRRGEICFAVNYSPEPRTVPAPVRVEFLLGARKLPPGGVAAWREERA